MPVAAHKGSSAKQLLLIKLLEGLGQEAVMQVDREASKGILERAVAFLAATCRKAVKLRVSACTCWKSC